MLTRKLYTTKLLLLSPVLSLWFTSGCTQQETPLKTSTWFMSNLKHIHQHEACLWIPCLLKTHCTRWIEVCLQGTAVARCCFITWNCTLFLSTDYSVQLAFTVLLQNYTRSSTIHFLTNLNCLYHKVLLQKALEHKCPSGMTHWNNQSPRKVFVFF